MIDFETIPLEQVIARGQFSMVRSKRESVIKALVELCQHQQSRLSIILKEVQEGKDVQNRFECMHGDSIDMADVVAEIEELTRQLELIRPLAFP